MVGSGSRADLPVWERTPRAVPPQLGPPPPIEAKAAPRRLTTIAAPVTQVTPVTAAVPDRPARVSTKPRTPWGVTPSEPANGHGAVAAPASAPVAPRLPMRRRPPTRRRLVAAGTGAVVAVVAVAATAMAMRSANPGGATVAMNTPTKPPTSTAPRLATTPSAPGTTYPPGTTIPQPLQNSDRSPVAQALANLAAQPLLRYSGNLPDGSSTWHLTVTADGEAQGALDLGGGELGVLEVGGRTYFKAADAASVSLLGPLPTGMTPASVRGKWVTGDSALEGVLPSGLASAGNLAASLQSGLPSQDAGSPPPTVQTAPTTPTAPIAPTAPGVTTVPGAPTEPAPSSTRVDGAPATVVSTAAGLLYISQTQPYQVLRLIPLAVHIGEPTEIDPVPQTSETPFFTGLIDQTRTLTDAFDFGVYFQYAENPKLSCSDSTCTVTVAGVSAWTSNQGSAPTGSVVADVRAVVSVGKQPAGQCEVSAELPLDQPRNLTCQDPDALRVVQSLGGGDPGFSAGLRFEARAETQADVDALVAAETNEQGGA